MTMREHLQLTTGPSTWLARAKWSHWNGHSAKGRATLWYSDLGTHRLGRVTVRLHRPRGNQLIDGHRHPHFTRMHLGGAAARGQHSWRWCGNPQLPEWQGAC